MNEHLPKAIQERVEKEAKRYKRVLRNKIDSKLQRLTPDQIPRKYMEHVYLTQVPVDTMWGRPDGVRVLALSEALARIAAELPFIQALNMGAGEHTYMLSIDNHPSGNSSIYLQYK